MRRAPEAPRTRWAWRCDADTFVRAYGEACAIAEGYQRGKIRPLVASDLRDLIRNSMAGPFLPAIFMMQAYPQDAAGTSGGASARLLGLFMLVMNGELDFDVVFVRTADAGLRAKRHWLQAAARAPFAWGPYAFKLETLKEFARKFEAREAKKEKIS